MNVIRRLTSRASSRNSSIASLKRSRKHTPWRRPLSVELLEERAMLAAQFVDLGPLRFCAESFTQNGSDYSASGTIQLGLAPTAGENFTPLVDILGSVEFTVGTSDPMFTVMNSTLASVVQTMPERIAMWTGTATFSVDDLAASGVSLVDATEFQVDGTNFTPSLLSFANPNGGATDDALLQLQGGLTIDEIGGLTVTVGGSDYVMIDTGGPALGDLEQAVSPTDTLTLFGLTLVPDQLNISYSSNQGEFSIYGTLFASTAGNEIVNAHVSLGTVAEPGITVQEGIVTQVEFNLPDGIEIWELQLDGSGLTWEYDGGLDRYEIYGDTSLSTSSPVYFAGSLGDSDAPGVTISGTTGEVEGFGMQVANPVIFGPLPFEVQDVVFEYDANLEEYQLSGMLSIPELFDATVSLGTADQPAVVYKAGKFELDDLTFSLSDVYLGAFVIDKFVLMVSYDDSADWSFEVDAVVWFPANFAVQAEIGFENGVLNTFGFGASGLNIEIGDTGLVIKELSGEVQNLDQPSDIIVSGSLIVAWGDTMTAFPTPVGNRDVALFGAKGAFTVDKDMLYLEGDFYAGMLLDPVTGAATGVIGEGQGSLTLDWGDDDYQMSLVVDGYWDTFELKGTISISGGDEIFFLAEADVNVPDFIPFIGGDTLGSVDFALRYKEGDPYSDDFVAGWVHVDLLFFTAEIGVKVNFSGHASVIGHHQIDSIENGSRDLPQSYQYFASFIAPEGATSALLAVDWPEAGGNQTVAVTLPDGTTIDQSQFSTQNNILLVPSLSSPTTSTVHLVGSATDQDVPIPPGQYQLTLTSDIKYSTPPTFTSGFFYPKPTIAVGQLPPNPGAGTVDIPLTATVDEAFESVATVSLFYDYDGMGYDGTPIAGLQSVPYQSLGATVPWDLSSLLPVPHYVYAVINDGTNVPVSSAYSNPITPQPPLSGQVFDQVHGGQALSGITVYIDLNHNGSFDPDTDPNTTTGSAGFYSFYGLTANTPYSVAVVVPHGYQMDPHSPSPNPTTVTWNGQDQVDADFGLDKLAAASGVVFDDLNQNGHQDPGEPGLQGWTVFLDEDGNGELDAGEITAYTASDGSYTFFDLSTNSTYTLGVVLQDNYFQTGPSPIPPGAYTVTIGTDPFQQVVGQDFGVLRFSTITGVVQGYLRYDGNVPTSPVVGLGGWTVELLSGDTVISTVTTAADGSYTFDGVRPGDYTIREVLPPGWLQMSPLPFFELPDDFMPGNTAAADFDGDGYIDLAVQVVGPPLVFIYRGNGDGTFSDQPHALVGGTFDPTRILALNFSGTGRPDLALISAEGVVEVWQNNGGGNFTLATNVFALPGGSQVLDVAAGDFDGDGRDDLALSYGGDQPGFAVLLSASRQVLTNNLAISGGLAAGDVNNDGKLDLVVNGGLNSLNFSVAYGDGTGRFSQVSTQDLIVNENGGDVALADFNGDGLLDAAFGVNASSSGPSGATWAAQQPGGVFQPLIGTLEVASANATISTVALGDIDGDSRLDLAVFVEGVGVSWWPYTGIFVQESRLDLTTDGPQTPPTAMTAADINGDGRLDLVFANPARSAVEIFLTGLSNDTPISVNVPVQQNVTVVDFTNGQFAQVGGRVFDDVNHNGQYDPGEPGRVGVTVYVDLNRNGQLDAGEPTSITGSNGLYGFDGLADGSYEIRMVPEVGRRLTTPVGGFHEVTIGAGLLPLVDKHFGSVVSIDLVLAMPESANDWTIRRNGDHLEVVDDSLGVVASELLIDLNSVTITGTGDRRSDRLTIDLATGGSFSLPDGITFQAGLGGRDTLQFFLGDADNTVVIEEQQAIIDAGLLVDWNGVERLVIDVGGGDNVLRISGRPVPGRIELLGGPEDDTYALATYDSEVRIFDSGGRDTLDFSEAGAGVYVDLARRGRQWIDALGNSLTVRGIENIVGSAFADVLIGDENDNLLRGGPGDDELIGKGGNDILVGDADYDLLSGGGGRDLLIGGLDADVLRGERGDDILIAGITAFDDVNEALLAIMAEWTSHHSYQERVQNLIDGTGSNNRNNGDYFLSHETVFNDFVPDGLIGGPGRDWFFVAPNDWQLDDAATVTIVELPALFGDYNRDGVVNAADYTVWRDHLGAEVVPFSGADGNADGKVDRGDYEVWKAHYGNTVEAQAVGTAMLAGGVEEPALANTMEDRARGMASLTTAESSIGAVDFARHSGLVSSDPYSASSALSPRAAWPAPEVIDEALTEGVRFERMMLDSIADRNTLTLLAAARVSSMQRLLTTSTDLPRQQYFEDSSHAMEEGAGRKGRKTGQNDFWFTTNSSGPFAQPFETHLAYLAALE